MKFTEFNLSESLLDGLRDIQFTEPTAIQEKAIPIVTAGKDLIATAQTGTGKTGAFIIPIMERVLQSERKGVKALIVSPTRELASQIDEQVFAIGYHAGISSATVIGGSDFAVQAKALKAGVDIIVATPGRLIDQNKVVGIDFSNLEYLVLDEADRMLDMGFMPDIKKIISWLPEKRQTLLFSATMPNEIKKLASSIMKNPESVAIERSKPSQSVEQRAYTLRSNQKVPLVKKIFKTLTWDSCIIFTSTKKGTDELHRLLKKEGIKSESIHGDRTQDERNRALSAFKNGQVPVIVATDVLARGIDIKGVSIIINYDVPNNTDDYIHRIGRTGRYDKSGIAITFVTRRDSRTFQTIEDIKGNKIKKIDLPENFGERSEFSWDEDISGAGKSGSSKQQSQPQTHQKSDGRQQRSGQSEKKEPKREKESTQKKESDVKQVQKEEKSVKTESKKPSAKKKKSSEQDQRRGKDSRGQKTAGKQEQKQQVKETKADEPKKAPVVEQKQESEKIKKVVIPPVIEKAVERNKRSRKPSKGIWGIIKSYIPKLKK
ncbi:MAG: DEAD/DEAH box helicase [Balneolaceae bacterium]|nr:MAG: DEAD/DEAH box helicase [Balneolaceae bacterium]